MNNIRQDKPNEDPILSVYKSFLGSFQNRNLEDTLKTLWSWYTVRDFIAD